MLNASIALSILGGSTSSGSTSTMSALTAFTNYNKDQVAARTAFANSDAVTSAIDDFKSSVKKMDGVEDLLSDRKSLTFVLSAFGLESDIDNVGKIRAVLNSDPDDVNSYANRLSDSRYGELAAFVNAPQYGTSKLKVSDSQSDLINKYLTNEFEKSIGDENEAARDALFFLRRINEVSSAYDILSDSTLRSIVTDALGLPAQIANQSVEKQAALIDAGIDLEAFQTSGVASGSASKLDTINDDLDSIKSAASALQAGQSATDSLVDSLEALRGLYQDYHNIVNPDGVNADEIVVQKQAIPTLLTQKGLVASADVATQSTSSALGTLKSLYSQALNAEDSDELATIQAAFERIANHIVDDDGYIKSATYTDPNTGLTQNLLLNGSSGTLPDGVDATPASISTVVDTDGTKVVTKSTDMTDFLDQVANLRDFFLGASFDTLDDDLSGASSLFNAVDDSFDSADLVNQINGYSLNNGLNSISFATEIDTASVAQGLDSVDDALTRMDRVGSILTDIRNLAQDAQADDADLDAINTTYAERMSTLKRIIETAGTVSDDSTTITLDNLLTDGTQTYNVLDGTSIQAEGTDLVSSLVDLLPDSITTDNAADLFDGANKGTYRETVNAITNSLTRDRDVIEFTAETVDPLGRYDAQIDALTDQVDTIIDNAEVDGTNLLSPYQYDLKLTLASQGAVLTVGSQSDFKENLTDALDTFRVGVLSGISVDDRISSLNDMLFSVGRTQSNLTAESAALSIQQQIVTSDKETIEGNGGDTSEFLQEQDYSPAAVKFIEKYLVKKDLESSGVSVGTTDARTAMASQLGSILPSASSGISLSLLV